MTPPRANSAEHAVNRRRRLSGLVPALLGIAGLAISSAATSANPKTPAAPLKVYISVDMEGVAGVVTGDQLIPGGFEYERFRRFMTDEAVAAVRGAQAAGATEVVVSDSHGNGESLLIELFPKDVRIVRSWPRHGEMMAGLDSSFGAALFVGYHASTTNPKGVRAHTISSAHFTRVALNGTAVTEAELNAAYAGALGVPVVFVSGDDAAISEVTTRLGSMQSVITKKTLGFHSAESLTPAAACDLIYQGALSAVAHRDQRKPYVVAAPVTLDISFKSYTSAEIVSYLRGVERTDSHSIRFVGRDMNEVMDFIVFLDYYSPDMAP
ncbi:MAG TPA: M55 family metallopeptidase [Steroidobacteraceae bacterium]|nr:M55 family metallopeptidase [Steroidobacteraceae bacterium]